MPDLSFELDRAYAIMTTDHGDESATDRLYRLWYHEQRGIEARFPWGSGYHAVTIDLSRFEPGWLITERVERDGAPAVWKVERAQQERIVACPDIVPVSMVTPSALFDGHTPPLQFQVGMAVAVNPLSCATSGGFWHLHSPLWESEGPADPRKRIYFSVVPGAELGFVERFAKCAPLYTNWAMKILCGPGPAGRRDSAVAYVPIETSVTEGWLPEILDALEANVGGPAPPGTLPVCPGVAWAPEISLTKSFGQLMCDVLVEVSNDSAQLLDRTRWTAAASERLHELVTSGSRP